MSFLTFEKLKLDLKHVDRPAGSLRQLAHTNRILKAKFEFAACRGRDTLNSKSHFSFSTTNKASDIDVSHSVFGGSNTNSFDLLSLPESRILRAATAALSSRYTTHQALSALPNEPAKYPTEYSAFRRNTSLLTGASSRHRPLEPACLSQTPLCSASRKGRVSSVQFLVNQSSSLNNFQPAPTSKLANAAGYQSSFDEVSLGSFSGSPINLSSASKQRRKSGASRNRSSSSKCVTYDRSSTQLRSSVRLRYSNPIVSGLCGLETNELKESYLNRNFTC